MEKLLAKKQKGFTIIEVLIVLAIAGLILLIVFLAVPALQRNQRNTTRNSEAARVAGLVTECLANRNGVTTSCDTAPEINFVASAFTQITGVTVNAGTASTANIRVDFNNQCNPDGSARVAGGGLRAFSVTYVLEPAIPRCIAS